MAREALTVGGAVVGFFIGGPAGAAIGAQIGGAVGSIVDPIQLQGPRLSDLRVTASTYGAPIPLIYGPENRIGGNIIWATDLKERKKKSGGKGGPEVTEYIYSVSLAVALGQGPIQRLKKIWANSKLLFDIDALDVQPDPPTPEVGMVVIGWQKIPIPVPGAGRQEGGNFSILRFYQGNGTQEVDPTIEAIEGVGNVPAYRHTAYVMLHDLLLADYGNAIPNLEFEVEAHESITVGAVVRDIFERAGITEHSTSSLTAPLRGFQVTQAGAAWQAVQPLTRAYHFDVADQAGQLRCVPRGRGLRAVIPIEDMGAREASDGGRIEPIRFETESDTRMPQEVVVNYADPAMDYQVNSQRASRAAGSSEHNVRAELPLVLTADEARQIADRELWGAWAGRRTARFTVSDRWSGLAPGDVVGLPAAGNVIPHLVSRVARGHNGVLEVAAAYEDPEAYLSAAVGAPPNIPANQFRLVGPTRLILMDIPILRDEDNNAGFYWAVSAEEPGWRGAQIERSTDAGETYNVMGSTGVRAIIGDVVAPLAAGPADIWDRGNTLTVVLHYAEDELESLSELAVLNGGNAAYIGTANGQGGEVIQFATAELIGPSTYELRDLLRGRLGTEHAIGTHGPDEVFVLLEADTLQRRDYGLGDLDRERIFRPVSNFTTPTSAPTQLFTNAGAGLRPLSPVHIRGTRDGGNDLTISWQRRTRLRVPGLGYGPVPLGEEVEAYEVDILNGSTVVRTISSSTPSVVYTAAEQAADGFTPGDLISVVVYQLSATRGRGTGGAATV